MVCFSGIVCRYPAGLWIRFTLSTHSNTHTQRQRCERKLAVHQPRSVPAAGWHLYCIFTRLPESLDQPSQCPDCTHLDQTHIWICPHTGKHLHVPVRTQGSVYCGSDPGPLDSTSLVFCRWCFCRELRVQNTVLWSSGCGAELGVLWFNRSPAKGLQSSACACVDFMLVSWTAAQLQGFPPQLQWQKEAPGPADMKWSSSGSALTQLFFSLTCQGRDSGECSVKEDIFTAFSL